MKQLMESRLFGLLAEVSKEEMYLTKLESAYEEFTVELQEKLQSETNITKLYYTLGLIRLELVGIRNNLSDEKEKKCFKCCN